MTKFKNECALLTLMLSISVSAEDSYSPYAEQHFPQNVYFGDTHLHTNMSADAYVLGNETLGPDAAYRFAKGEAIEAHNGMKARLGRPLDFLVVADHASNMGVFRAQAEGNKLLLHSEDGVQWAADLAKVKSLREKDFDAYASQAISMIGRAWYSGWIGGDDYLKNMWSETTQLADQHNDPGTFTAFIGYEWTQLFYSLHRVVLFRDGADKASQFLPFAQYDSNDPEDLWQFFQAYEKQTGGHVLAIPHNANLTRGVMFALENAKGQRLTKGYANTRSRWEPLYEVTQIKGDSETHPVVSPDDEFANFERMSGKLYPLSHPDRRKELNYTDYLGWIRKNHTGENSDWMRQYEYARPALKLGLSEQARLGVNPFKFGLIGSTDAHTSMSAVAENNFWGKNSVHEPGPQRANPQGAEAIGPGSWPGPVYMGASGYAAVWAEENTRESLFAAMKRRETYATTGPRMTVRFFGGWDYATDDAHRPDLAKLGYAGGVPMGGDLTAAPKGKAPSFLIRAVKDADGANLDRVQVIKGWRSADGELHEKIYNVALSGGRRDEGSKTEPVGSTVDVKEASYANTIGTPELATVWRDPDFKTDELAFYYVRVLEIPTPRWTAYDAKYFGLKNIPDEVPMVTQERAYTSPIWYTP